MDDIKEFIDSLPLSAEARHGLLLKVEAGDPTIQILDAIEQKLNEEDAEIDRKLAALAEAEKANDENLS